MRYLWSRLPIRRQLTLAVNGLLLLVVSAFLFVGHQLRVRDALHQQRVALSEEAKTIYESVDAIANRGNDSIQKLIDDVCARMNSQESPGHHIAVDWQGSAMQAKSHGRASHDNFQAMRLAVQHSEDTRSAGHSIIVGSFGGPKAKGTVYVAESKATVLANAQFELFRQILAVFVAGVLAALMVNLVLRRVVTKPLRRLVTALKSIGDGESNVLTKESSCQELSFLTEQINAMSVKLDAADEDRRVQMRKARRIQQHLRPVNGRVQGIATAELFEPAEDVGGDYYDVIAIGDDRCLLCLADVSGHGVPAAMAATVIKALVLEALEVTESPAEILTRINRRYTGIIMSGHFATMVIVVIDTSRNVLTCANAGHEPPFVHMPGKPVERIEGSDLVLGVDENAVYSDQRLSIEHGMKIVLVSDGVTETFDPEDNQFGTERVSSVMAEAGAVNSRELVDCFSQALQQFRKSRPPFDDTTLLVTELTGRDLITSD